MTTHFSTKAKHLEYRVNLRTQKDFFFDHCEAPLNKLVTFSDVIKVSMTDPVVSQFDVGQRK